MATATAAKDTYLRHATLAELPTKIRALRKLERACHPVTREGGLDDQRRALSKTIDADLAGAGLERGDCVTCLGFEVYRRGQKGRSYVDTAVLRELLVAKGVAGDVVDTVIQTATKSGDPSAWAEVRAPKGAKLRR